MGQFSRWTDAIPTSSVVCGIQQAAGAKLFRRHRMYLSQASYLRIRWHTGCFVEVIPYDASA